MHEVLVNRLGGLSLPRKSVVSLADRPNMTLNVYRGRKKQQHTYNVSENWGFLECRKILKIETSKLITASGFQMKQCSNTTKGCGLNSK